ncbi:MAG: alpha-D-ribose 1-methylphosphonate 5-triphosphate diphosphatase [Shimia sp.]
MAWHLHSAANGIEISTQGAHVAPSGGQDVDLSGFALRPGIIDLHGDGFERHLAPRRGAQVDLVAGLFALEAELASCGITTAYLAQFWSWEGGMRSPAFAKRLLAALEQARPHLSLDLRIQLRLETHMMDDFGEVLTLIDTHGIEVVIFNDHLPHDRLSSGRPVKRLTGTALKSGRSPEAHLALMQSLHARTDEVPGALADLAAKLSARGVRMGSHDDLTAEGRAAFRALGADIAEFPERFEAVEAAHAAGDPVIMGAPNIVRGGSHGRGIPAQQVVDAGQCDALVSDYHYPSLKRAGEMTDWALISAGPAQVMGLSDRGAFTPGQRADLCVIDTTTGRVAGTMCAGRWVHLAPPLIARLLG